METNKQQKSATDTEIRAILGSSTDDSLVMAVRNTGASYGEVLEAFEWIVDDDYMGKKARRPAAGVVARVCDILQEDEYKED